MPCSLWHALHLSGNVHFKAHLFQARAFDTGQEDLWPDVIQHVFGVSGLYLLTDVPGEAARASEWKWYPLRLMLPYFDFPPHIFQLYLRFKPEPNYPIICVNFSDNYVDRAEYLVLVKVSLSVRIWGKRLKSSGPFDKLVQEHPCGERTQFYLPIGRDLDGPIASALWEGPKLHSFLDRAPLPSQGKTNGKNISWFTKWDTNIC